MWAGIQITLYDIHCVSLQYVHWKDIVDLDQFSVCVCVCVCVKEGGGRESE